MQYYKNKSISFIANFSVYDVNTCDPDIYDESQGGNNYSYTCRLKIVLYNYYVSSFTYRNCSLSLGNVVYLPSTPPNIGDIEVLCLFDIPINYPVFSICESLFSSLGNNMIFNLTGYITYSPSYKDENKNHSVELFTTKCPGTNETCTIGDVNFNNLCISSINPTAPIYIQNYTSTLLAPLPSLTPSYIPLNGTRTYDSSGGIIYAYIDDYFIVLTNTSNIKDAQHSGMLRNAWVRSNPFYTRENYPVR